MGDRSNLFRNAGSSLLGVALTAAPCRPVPYAQFVAVSSIHRQNVIDEHKDQ